jgi:glycosyltransferase involved in cell wall biosynthesis
VIADAFVHLHSAYTSLERLAQVGLMPRERRFASRVLGGFGHAVVASYGESGDATLAGTLAPAGWGGTLQAVTNEGGLNPAVFQAGLPMRVLAALTRVKAKSALVYQDQHCGGEVAIQVAEALRGAGIRVGLVARCGYHWSWTVARETAPNGPGAMAAAFVEGEFCRAADVVVATTPVIAEMLAWQHRLDIGGIRVVPNYVDVPGEAPEFSSRAARRILYAGRLEAEKRVELLVRAVGMAADEVPGVELRIVGDGSKLEMLRGLAAEVGARVEFCRRLEHHELMREMGACGVYAQVSRFEGHPKTILEAMAMGAPCVVTRAPGVDSEINPGVTGVICGDRVEDVARALAGVLKGRAAAERMGSAAAADIRGRLSFERVMPKLEEAFVEAMRISGAGKVMASSPVRWEQSLLNVNADAAAVEFAASIGGYAKRLSPGMRAMFLEALNARVGSIAEMQGAAVTAAMPGVPAVRR